MKTNKKKIFWISIGTLGLFFLIGVVITGCTNPAPMEGTVNATVLPSYTPSYVNTQKIKAGGALLWANNCFRCHNFRSPASQTDAEWNVIGQHMRLRANLTGEEYREILDFLKAGN